MNPSQCPLCYSPLEVQDVTPCFICGGWPDSVTQFNPTAEFNEFRLPSDQLIVLCRACELEEFMVPGGWGYRLCSSKGLPINALQRVREIALVQLTCDKFCPACHLRLRFIEILADAET